MSKEAAGRVEWQALEPVSDSDRHGRAGDSGWLWFAANLGLPPWSLGLLAVALGMSPLWAAIAVVAGNAIGVGLMAAVAGFGPESGLPAIALSGRLFGKGLNRVPAVLNAVSCLGWYAVNAVLGGEALSRLLGLGLVWGIALLTVLLAVVAAFGHDLVHRLERVAAYALAVLFVATAIRIGIAHASTLHPVSGASPTLGTFLLALAIIASYQFSWGPYASDYARYLPRTADRRSVVVSTFAGGFAATVAVELLGILTAMAVGTNAGPVAAFANAAGPWAPAAMGAAVLGALTANALNVYTGGLSTLAAGLRLGRPAVAVVFALAGGVAAYLGSHGFDANYENFLLLISYWVAPWIGIVLAFGLARPASQGFPAATGRLRVWLFGSFIAGLAATVPLMNQTLYEGPVARLLGGGDIGYWAGVLVAFVLARLALSRAAARHTAEGAGAPEALPTP